MRHSCRGCNLVIDFSSFSKIVSFQKWHNHLGHIHMDMIKRMITILKICLDYGGEFMNTTFQ